MTATQTNDSPVACETVSELSAPRNWRERAAIRSVIVLVVGIVGTAITLVVGPDVRAFWRHFARVPVALPVVDEISSIPADRSTVASPLDRSLTLAADAQISPPRRRVVEPETVVKPLEDANELATKPIDPVVVPEPSPSENAQRTPEPRQQEVMDPTTTLLETAAQLVSRSWQDFDYPAPWFAGETSKTRMIYSHHRSRLLKAVAHPQPSTLSLEFARKDYAAAVSQFNEDPRLDYVFGLALWKHGHFAEAIETFQTAARLDKKPFLPAALAVAWGRFLNHEERRGLDQLQQIARVLAASSETYPPDTQKEQAALAMGRAMGYLSKSGRVPDLAETIELTSITLRRRLPVELQGAYDIGFSEVSHRESELLHFIEMPDNQLQTGHRLRHDDLQSKIDALRTEMRDAHNTLSRGHRTHVETIADVLKEGTDIRGQMEKLRPSIRKLQESISKITKPQPHVEKKTMPGHFDLVVGPAGQSYLVQSNATMTLFLSETASERATRISQLSKARDELKKIQDELSKLRDQQQDLVARRHAEDRQHLEDKDEARRLRVVRLEEQRELEQRLQELNKALARTMTLREGFDTIAAYIPWNVEIEAEALRVALNPKLANRRTDAGPDESSFSSRSVK